MTSWLLKKEEKDRQGARLKMTSLEGSETFSYYTGVTGDTLEMEQETRTREEEVMSDRVN